MSHQINEEPCPVADSVLGQLYRSSPQGLAQLIETVPPSTRATLAIYCYRRAHLTSIGLAIAASCDEHDLYNHAGYAGSNLFAKSRAPEAAVKESFHTQRRKVTLATGPIRYLPPLADDLS